MTDMTEIITGMEKFADFLQRTYNGSYTEAEFRAPVKHPSLGLSENARQESIAAIEDVFSERTSVAVEENGQRKLPAFVIISAVLRRARRLHQLSTMN